MEQLRDHQQAQLRSVAGVVVHANEPAGQCPRCEGTMRVRKTVERKGMTLAHGRFIVRETIHVCAAGCRVPSANGQVRALVRRQAEPAELLLPRSTVGYDVLSFVGVQRFLFYRQREAIGADLEQRYGIVLSAGELSALAKKFCVYLKALHLAHARTLGELLQADGGWPMHVDATGEDGQGTLLVIYAGWRHWVLGAWKIPTERAEAIMPRMIETAKRFGSPCAVMRDLGRAVIEASSQYIATLDECIPNLGCHMHFVRDVGKDLLHESHDALRELFRRFGVVADLRALTRELGRHLASEIGPAREQLIAWLDSDERPYALPAGQGALAVVRALAQWTLDYAADAHDEGFPFDRPWYDLYTRCLKTTRVAEAFLCKGQANGPALRALRRLFAIVVKIRSEVPFGKQASTLAERAKLLDELRAVLRIQLKPNGRNPVRPPVLSAEQAIAQLRDVKAGLEQFTESLRARRPHRGPAQNQRAAIDLILDHLDRHGPSLFGHVITLPEALGGGVRVVERTNVVLESFFHSLKRGERRRSGRKNLGQDLEHLPPEAAIALNLRCSDYLQVVCGGSLDGLAAAFAKLDRGHRDKSLAARASADQYSPDTVSASMTTIDRKIVRTQAMIDRVNAAASTRSARLA